MKSFTAPESLRELGEGAFAGCRKLKTVTLNEGLRSIGETGVGVFQDSGLRAAYIPSLLQKLRKETFVGCKNLRKITVAEGCDVRLEYCLSDGGDIRTEASVTGDAQNPCFGQNSCANTPRTASNESDQQIQALREQLWRVT